MRAVLVLCALPLAGPGATPAPALTKNCPIEHQESRRDDTGALELLVRRCESRGFKRIAVSAVLDPGGERRPLFSRELPLTEAPYGRARLFDLDGDGRLELEVVGGCGAGPNCEGSILRRTAPGGAFEPLFQGSYATLAVVDGHLIVGGRASCCSWEYRAYPLDRTAGPIDEAAPSFRIDVEAAGEESKPDVTCTFFELRAPAPRPVDPPGSAWTSICETYGAQYRIARPATGLDPK